VYPFALNSVLLELFEFMRRAGGFPQLKSFGVKRMHLIAGMLETDDMLTCHDNCDVEAIIGRAIPSFRW